MTGNNEKKHGFTLVELLITGFIFSIIFGVATSTFVSAIRIQKYNMAHQQLLDQTSYAMEYMARALRMAKVDTGSCGVGNNVNYKLVDAGVTIRFKNYNDECQEFSWVDLDLDGNLETIVVTIDGRLEDVPLNSPDYLATRVEFTIGGEKRDTDDLQPRATVFMELQNNILREDKPKIIMQTTVSQRNLDE